VKVINIQHAPHNLPRGLRATLIAVMSDKRENLRNQVLIEREIDELIGKLFSISKNEFQLVDGESSCVGRN
jgi:hypothetical protein